MNKKQEAIDFFMTRKHHILRILREKEREISSPPFYGSKCSQILKNELGLELPFATEVLEIAKDQGYFRYVISQDSGKGFLWDFWVGEGCQCHASGSLNLGIG